MSVALFEGHPAAELVPSMREFLEQPDVTLLLVERADGSVAGFVEAGTRRYADGCDTSPVGYVEAWYVEPDVRRQGYGTALLEAAERWARGRGYVEMASDAQLHNTVSQSAHRHAGYAEVDRIVQFRKLLP